MIKYLVGDATKLEGRRGNVILAQGCNDEAKWGSGFVLAVSKKWPMAERAYRTWPKSHPDKPIHREADGGCFSLGSVQFVAVESPIGKPGQESYQRPFLFVANMITQRGIKAINGSPPVRYYAIAKALTIVAAQARLFNASVHMPKVGCGLAGGDWNVVEYIVEQVLEGIDVFVYEFKDTSSPSFVTQEEITRRLV